MISDDEANELQKHEVCDPSGDRIGSVGQIWVDGEGHPAWALVDSGFLGKNKMLVPLNNADVHDDRLMVAFDKSHVEDGPEIDAAVDEPLTDQEVDDLYVHYGLA